jgi:ATP-binding cassette, subfamily F, member 3
MISLDNVSKGFAGRVLFSGVSLRVAGGDRVGIVGANGAGKSTLLALIRGAEEPDSGSVSRARNVDIQHLSQQIVAPAGATVLETVLRPSERLAAVEADLALAHEAFARAHDDGEKARVAGRLADLHSLHHELSGRDREARAKRVLAGLGFRPGDEHRPLESFSGGYVMRAELARLLTDLPDLLLLDEPTNHLDLESVLWLQGFLVRCPASLMVVSHDRGFLQAVATAIVEVESGRVRRYPGDYDAYVRQSELDREQLEAQAREQERRFRETERFIDRFRYKASKARQVQSRVKALAREERIVLARDRRPVRIRFPQPERTSDPVLELIGAAKSYGDHPVYNAVDFVLRRGEKTVLVGPNGAGKSTLLKLLAGALALDAGHRRVGHNVTVGYYTQHREEMLDPGRTVLENALARARGQTETVVRSLLGAFLFPGDEVKKSVSVLSGGEKSRLALALILLDPPSVMLMDEPTIHLDVPSVDALIAALVDFEGALCFVSHDVHFIRSVARRVVRVEAGSATDYPGDWEYYCWRRATGGASTAAGGDPTGPLPSGAGAPEGGGRTPPRGAPPSSAVPGSAPERSGRGQRLERRMAAEARAALARRLRPLRERLRHLEAEIEDLELEKAGIEADLADPATYAEVGVRDLPSLNRRHADVGRDLALAMDAWLETAGSIEALERESDGEEIGEDEQP